MIDELLNEMAIRYNIPFQLLDAITWDLFRAKNCKDWGEHRPIDNSDVVEKIISSRPLTTLPKDENTVFDPNYREVLDKTGAFVQHPIQKISFKLDTGEILNIKDPTTIEVIRWGLEYFRGELLKTNTRNAHRPKSKRRYHEKKAALLIKAAAPDGSENSKYLFIGNIFADMGYLKNYEAWDNDPGGAITHEEYLIDKIKNILTK